MNLTAVVTLPSVADYYFLISCEPKYKPTVLHIIHLFYLFICLFVYFFRILQETRYFESTQQYCTCDVWLMLVIVFVLFQSSDMAGLPRNVVQKTKAESRRQECRRLI